MNLFIRETEPGDGKRNSIMCQAAEWRAAFDRTFSLIACISLRDLFIKRILHFKISGSVSVASGYFSALIEEAVMWTWSITVDLRGILASTKIFPCLGCWGWLSPHLSCHKVISRVWQVPAFLWEEKSIFLFGFSKGYESQRKWHSIGWPSFVLWSFCSSVMVFSTKTGLISHTFVKMYLKVVLEAKYY